MDKFYMNLALELAKKGKGKVNPNPMVGAVIVKDNKIIAQEYHEEYGNNHAEINAINNAKENLEGSTMYVTLEPCSHYGKTPPCVEKIIETKISKVVIASLDPNPLVSGKGVKKLVDAGVEVVTGILDYENKKLNEVFMKYIVKKIPFVIMKSAMSLDGKISTRTGESKWISSDESRENVHKLRNEVMGILVGVNTIIQDNPQLTCRLENGKTPIKIVVDSNLRIPLDSKVIKDAHNNRTIIITTSLAKESIVKELENKGVEIIIAESKDNSVDLNDMVKKLGQLNIDSILLEGGATLNFSAIKEGIVDKLQVYIAPKLIGGKLSKTPIGGNGIEKLKDAYQIRDISVKMLSEDILIEGYL
ncbi:bifunctional diaminohydroxyphosphoribosylaminopyrimidine deaminase/5-amino-6-(5-phosphoribosylamino)uracil reductase RibD [Clostridium sp. CCUG 7971]|uniref:bifunctional diaminohydroxyphosphoribosylaminopyrimidine deaminase/5-amino-6-(5-phosphoribosylamino)uracil reductase RibD n=1 Tax=Clostridium sp. CCUG 7971 TaxID=2811414 RepID=UPI001ABB7E3B|nr:bifunctional diaminohydroxyphosphoribosylaminopyrimidine deaminase/5-amino-6-(5-phosphoribosylamino)uracil reductase RibD [Clostridium sp. CCUG 7971]MBO3446062.1 bifunctional diaminohydroxyphosphoribosylaminopyrimidine deaminase/5-amino-6-(5-phosphoribosylamino)uracil reductase RibD [Clostridium sp. CCUG 7971]